MDSSSPAVAWVQLDRDGSIARVGEAWPGFLRSLGGRAPRAGLGLDYLSVLRTFVPSAPESIGDGVRRVLTATSPIFEAEHRCDGGDGARWIRTVVTPCAGLRAEGAIVTHLDVTAEAVSRREARRLHALALATSAMSRVLPAAREVRPLLASACRALVERGGMRIACAEWIDPDGRTISAGWGEDPDAGEALDAPPAVPLERRPGIEGEAYRTGRPAFSAAFGDGGRWNLEQASRLGLASCIAVPLPRGERPGGALVACSRDDHAFGPGSLSLLGSMAASLSLAVTALEREREMREHEAHVEQAERIAQMGRWELTLPDLQWLASPETYRILGVEPGVFADTQEAFLDLVHPEDRVGVRRAQARALAGEAGLDLEHRIIRADGEVRHVRQRAALLGPSRLLGTLQDVTDHRRVERQLLRAERLETIATLASGVGHDLNNALSPILLSLELLKSGGLVGPQALETLAGIEASAHRGAEVVRQLLTFAPVAEGSRVDVQVRHLLREVERIARNTFPKSIGIHAKIPARLWQVTGEPAQLQQVILSLCLNARDAMPEGGTLTVTAENLVLDEHYSARGGEGAPGPYVSVCVEDTGHGVPAVMLNRIFDPFFTTRGRGGTGLGLSTALAVVRNHGGFIRVQSSPGAGAVFRVYLPALPGPGPAPAGGEFALPRGRGECVLVVDDEVAVREVTRHTLERNGYRPLLAADGADGLVTFARHRNEIAVVLTDMMMPLVDGTAMLAALRRTDPQVRIVVMSGTGSDGHPPGPGGGDRQHFLAKPFTAAALLTTLRAALDSDGRED